MKKGTKYIKVPISEDMAEELLSGEYRRSLDEEIIKATRAGVARTFKGIVAKRKLERERIKQADIVARKAVHENDMADQIIRARDEELEKIKTQQYKVYEVATQALTILANRALENAGYTEFKADAWGYCRRVQVEKK